MAIGATAVKVLRRSGAALLLCTAAGGAFAADSSKDHSGADADATSEKKWSEHVTLYGRLDLMYYRYKQGGVSEDTWNLNGVRDTVLGLKSVDHPVGEAGLTPVFALEVGYGTERGATGRDFSLSTKQALVGFAGDWGKVTYGRQYTVMNNIAWSVLNPLAQNWGINYNDPLYAGDSFTHGSRDRADVLEAGSNFFYGFTQTGLTYQRQDSAYSLEMNLVPGSAERGKGRTIGIGGTVVSGSLTVAAAVARQSSALDSASRNNQVLGLVYALDKHINLSLAHLSSRSTGGARHANTYGGFNWRVNDQMTVSALYSRYRQNEGALYGAGRSKGFAAVLEYAINNHLTAYLEADQRSIRGGEDGFALTVDDRLAVRNTMVGLHVSF